MVAETYVSYFFRYGKIVEDFKLLRYQLESKKVRVENDVEEAKRQAGIIEANVQKWLTRATKELGEARSLADEIERGQCFSWCPSWGWRYCLSKKVAKNTLDISKLLETSYFSRVGYRAPLEGIEWIPSKDVMPFESSKSTLNGIMKALESDVVSMIGLYGMPGVGKTTLARKVGKQARQKQLFDKVVMITMSQSPKIHKIQDKIAEILGLILTTSTEGGRAEELIRRLKDEKKMLIIIDDVWQRTNLLDIGIPLCGKVLLTTRLHQVCIQMDCQEIFRLDILSYDEAWALFKDTAGLKDVSPTLADIAKEVACECQGLPLAIVTIGKALKGESLDGWRAANQRLKDSRYLDDEHVCERIYSSLKLSYDYLRTEMQSFFLLCSLFPEDYDISIDVLAVCGIGQGLFCDIDLMEERRREICVAVTRLQKFGLLLETENEGFIRMHNVVRDFAHWITSQWENKFMVEDGLIEWPMGKSFGYYTAVSLWNCKISNLPDILEFPELEIFFLMGNNSMRASSMFFEEMKVLRVLCLKNVVLSLEALRFLTDLRTLWLEACELYNISSLRYMKSLEILALFDTNIDKLPEELEELHRLKSLYFSGKYFPTNLISRLYSLQELFVLRENNINIPELNSLCRLTALRISIGGDNFQENFMFPKLYRYDIAVNMNCDHSKRGSLRTLKVKDIGGRFASSLSAFKELFYNVENLTLQNIIMEHKNIVPDVDWGGLNELTFLELRECEDLECLIDATREQGPTTAFFYLEELNMERLTCFKELCRGQPPIGFLQKLKDVSIEDCERLQVVFQMDGLAENLASLCLSSLPELERIWEAQTPHSSLQNLKVVKIRDCKKLTYIFSHCIPQSLEELEISHCKGLEQVFDLFGETDGKEFTFPQLKHLVLKDLISLRRFFSGNCSIKLPSLEQIQVLNCPHLPQFMVEADVITTVESTPVEITTVESTPVVSSSQAFNAFSAASANILATSSSASASLASSSASAIATSASATPRAAAPAASSADVPLRAFNKLVCNAKILTRSEVVHQKTLVPSVNLKGPNELTFPVPEELECLIDTIGQVHDPTGAFFNLVELVIKNMAGLKMLYKGPFPEELLQNLNELRVINCLQLQEVFQIDEHLHDREIKEALLLSNLTRLDLDLLPKLERIWKGPTLYVSLQRLKIAEIRSCHRLDHLFSPSLAQSLKLLEKLKIRKCHGLRHIIAELESGDAIESDGAPLLPKLRNLKLENLINLSSFCSENNLIRLPSLEKLKARNCPRLENLTIQTEVNEQAHPQENQAPALLSKLTYLELKSLPQLSCIWKAINLQSLKTMEIGRCHKLAYLFLPTVAQTLENLEQLQIYECESLKHLIIEAENEDETASNMCWPKLKTLKINDCGSLEYVLPITLAQGLSCLESVQIIDCHRLMQVFNMAKEEDGQDIKLQSLQVLELGNLENLRRFGPENFVIPLFLKEFKVYNCPLLTHFANQQELPSTFGNCLLEDVPFRVFKELVCNAENLTLGGVMYPKENPKGLNEWTSLKLEHGEDSKCLIDTTKKGNLSTNAFINLVELVVKNMTGLKLLCNGRYPKGFLQKLKKLEIRNCMEIVSLSPALQNLKEIKVIKCGQLQEVFQIDELLHDREKNQALLLSNLTHLELDSLLELKWIWKGPTRFVSLQCLKFVEIRQCHGLEYLFSPSLAPSLLSLEELKIDHCERLQHIVTRLEDDAHDLHPLHLPKLETLEISDCPRLECVFQIPLARVLPKLKSVRITNSPQLKEVFNVAEEENGVVRAFELSCLQYLQLENLKNLSCFCSKNYPILLSSLKRLSVWNCPRLTNFNIPKEVKEQIQPQELYLSNCEKIFETQAGNFLLKVVHLRLNLIHQLQGPIHATTLQYLRMLTVSKCDRLKSLFSLTLAETLPQLSNLYIMHCEKLEKIIEVDQTSLSSQAHDPKPRFLPSLEFLLIEECNNLERLFPLSVTHSLSKFKKFIIHRASKLEQVFGYQGELDVGDDQKIRVFPELREISLIDLPRLERLVPMDYHFQFPCLDYREVRGCSKFSIDSNSAITEAY